MPTANTTSSSDVELTPDDVDALISALEQISASVTEAIAILEYDAVEHSRCSIVQHAAGTLMTRIDAVDGHCARHLLKVIVEELTAHPDELGNAVAILRIVERNLPVED